MKYVNSKQKAYDLFQESWKEAEKNEMQLALELINEAIEISPRCSLYWTTKAQFVLELGNLEEARSTAQVATDLDSGNAHAWALLGEVHGLLGQSESAASCLLEAVRLEPDHVNYTLLASVQAEYDPEAAMQSAQKALQINPNWDEATRIVAVSRERMGNA